MYAYFNVIVIIKINVIHSQVKVMSFFLSLSEKFGVLFRVITSSSSSSS